MLECGCLVINVTLARRVLKQIGSGLDGQMLGNHDTSYDRYIINHTDLR